MAPRKKATHDTKVALRVAGENDRQVMQTIIDNLAKWAKTWDMSFNVKKCKIIHAKARVRGGSLESMDGTR